MKWTEIILKRLTYTTLIILILAGLLSFGTTIESKLAVISHQNGAPKEITFSNLQTILRGEKPRWEDGTKVRIALMKPRTNIGELTARKIYQMSANELNKYWLALVFQGRTSPPKFFNYEEELTKYIQETEGAIGVISFSDQLNEADLVYVNGKSSIE